MKASNDLSRQALVNKLMKGKELPANSLLAAGMDPTMTASTPRSVRHFQSESAPAVHDVSSVSCLVSTA